MTKPPRIHRIVATIFRWTSRASLLLVIGGLYTAAFRQRVGAYLLVGGFIRHLAVFLSIGIVEYRSVMRRPWPQVAPLDDDEDW